MFMAFHTTEKRRPRLIALFGTLLIVGSVVLVLARA